jgi:hypothetical protein
MRPARIRCDCRVPAASVRGAGPLRGRGAQLSAALERTHACAHEPAYIELVWHAERWDVLARINADPAPSS